MSFLSDLASDLKTSVSKSATNAYNTALDKAQDAANSLFQKASVGDIADLKTQTIPASAAPQQIAAPVSTSPTAPAAIAAALPEKAANASRIAVVVLALAAIIYFIKKD